MENKRLSTKQRAWLNLAAIGILILLMIISLVGVKSEGIVSALIIFASFILVAAASFYIVIFVKHFMVIFCPVFLLDAACLVYWAFESVFLDGFYFFDIILLAVVAIIQVVVLALWAFFSWLIRFSVKRQQRAEAELEKNAEEKVSIEENQI